MSPTCTSLTLCCCVDKALGAHVVTRGLDVFRTVSDPPGQGEEWRECLVWGQSGIPPGLRCWHWLALTLGSRERTRAGDRGVWPEEQEEVWGHNWESGREGGAEANLPVPATWETSLLESSVVACGMTASHPLLCPLE